jgi:hypothetical protein
LAKHSAFRNVAGWINAREIDDVTAAILAGCKGVLVSDSPLDRLTMPIESNPSLSKSGDRQA